ncbi:hypothetical protein B9Z19DRAFT_1066869 [Tuber borchii]|uniref:Uncharacterized protein n=1 Tax=Tuber borchii TaxID=42251 RepID=A0A2T6ZKW5_TUBBO|nr:hypothetical protein B9Z19DRAFT_1066869 [Tuber borchii]
MGAVFSTVRGPRRGRQIAVHTRPRNLRTAVFVEDGGPCKGIAGKNGTEYTTSDGKTRWRCSRCPPKGAAITFSDSSAKSMIEHLREVYKIGKDGPIALEHGKVLIEAAFGKTRSQVAFNSDLFRDLLLRWIVENHISFRQVEQASFRVF